MTTGAQKTFFTPEELGLIETVLEEWAQKHCVALETEDAALAGEVIMSIFSDGHRTLDSLREAADAHKALAELGYKSPIKAEKI